MMAKRRAPSAVPDIRAMRHFPAIRWNIRRVGALMGRPSVPLLCWSDAAAEIQNFYQRHINNRFARWVPKP
jgi:hypothetical protein